MSSPKKPAIWADAMRLATEIEVAVRGVVGAALAAKNRYSQATCQCG
jgi:hypothetical protein